MDILEWRNFTICLCTMCLHSSSGQESILYKSFENEALEYPKKCTCTAWLLDKVQRPAPLYAVAKAVRSPDEIKFLQPQLLRVTSCCVTAMNIVQLPFSNEYMYTLA